MLAIYEDRQVFVVVPLSLDRRSISAQSADNKPFRRLCPSARGVLGACGINAISSTSVCRNVRILLIRLEKVFEKSVNLVVRLRCRAVAFPIGHGYAVGISQKSVDGDRMIESLPALGRIFGAA